MNVTFRQLKVFLAVAEQLNITAAARVCCVTQPTVSMQLRELTAEVGQPLYEQIGKRIYLTAAGEALARTARAMVQEWSAFEQHMDGLKGLTRGRLRLAVVSTAETFIPRLLGDFRRERPAVEVSLVVLNRDAVIRRLADNLDDLYIMSRPPQAPPVVATPFLSNPLVVVAAAEHPLAGRETLQIEALAAEEFVLREPGSGTRQAAEHFFAAHGLALRPRLELGSNEAVKQAVAGGLGLSLLSAHALAHAVDEGIAVLRVDGTPLPTQWQVVYPAGKRLTPLAGAFLEFLRERAAELERSAQERLDAARR